MLIVLDVWFCPVKPYVQNGCIQAFLNIYQARGVWWQVDAFAMAEATHEG
jgi:hypothetical protein